MTEDVIDISCPRKNVRKETRTKAELDDLKRGIQVRLNKLERRTQKTIVAMLKERLELEVTQAVKDDDDDDDDNNDNSNDLD